MKEISYDIDDSNALRNFDIIKHTIEDIEDTITSLEARIDELEGGGS